MVTHLYGLKIIYTVCCQKKMANIPNAFEYLWYTENDNFDVIWTTVISVVDHGSITAMIPNTVYWIAILIP